MKSATFALAAAALLPFLAACKSKTTLTDEMSPALNPDVMPGSYYRISGLGANFYNEQPDSLIGKIPTTVLGPRHVVQLLDPNAGNGWARVRNGNDDIGFIKFDNIKIVPFEQQPKAPKRKKQWYDE